MATNVHACSFLMLLKLILRFEVIGLESGLIIIEEMYGFDSTFLVIIKPGLLLMKINILLKCLTNCSFILSIFFTVNIYIFSLLIINKIHIN